MPMLIRVLKVLIEGTFRTNSIVPLIAINRELTYDNHTINCD